MIITAKFQSFRQSIPQLHHYLLIAFAFLIPLSTALNNIVMGLIVILWLIEGNFNNKYQTVKSHPLALWILFFFLTLTIGLLWSEDLTFGGIMLGKEAKFLLFPIFLTIMRPEHFKSYLFAFIAAMFISELVSYGIWLEWIPPTSNCSDIYSPTPFMTHIFYSPLLAFTIYLLAHELLFDPELSKKQKWISSLFIMSMTYNLFISGGRAGQVAFFIIAALITFQYFRHSIFKALILLTFALPLLFVVMYFTSSSFEARVNMAINNVKTFNENANTPVGQRITYNINTLSLIMKNPFFGVGTGDFKTEYTKINEQNSPNVFVPDHPHNMYLLVLSWVGIFGFIPFLMIFITQLRIAMQKVSPVYRIQAA
ncbi:MAG: O-antigen ligase family protein, partial [Campylobacterales bacterium]|nr:O-antigen ligase family protein [Campylobacterales bacterium]